MVWICDILRLDSCSRTPRKIFERVFERAMHPMRVVRCQDLLPPAFQLVGGRTAIERRELQRPAKMLAGVAKTDAQAVMAADLVIQRADKPELLRKRRRSLGRAAVEAPPDL